MAQQLFDLQRTFTSLKDGDWSDVEELMRSESKYVNWDQILEHSFSVVIGAANSGKTSEFRLRARTILDSGGHAWFIPLRRVTNAVESIDIAFDENQLQVLGKWKNSPDEILYMFVDSIDEAALRSSEELRQAIRRLVKLVGGINPNIRWVFSTRPVTLNAEVREAISGALGVNFPLLQTEASVTDDLSLVENSSDSTTKLTTVSQPGEIRLYQLRELTLQQTRTYVRKRFSTGTDAEAVIQAARIHGLNSMLKTPGKLNVLVKMDIVARPPSNLVDAYQRCTTLLLADDSGRLGKISNASSEQFKVAANRIASASTLCEKLNIALPSGDEEVGKTVLSAHVVEYSLSPVGLTHLLTVALFEEAQYNQVKLQPDDFRFYLAARHLHELIRDEGDAERVFNIIGWRAISGESGVIAKWLPMGGWLATFNPHFRRIVIEHDPQCLALFGDLRSIPHEDAKRALSAAIHRIANGEKIGKDSFRLTSDNYWQAGAPTLHDVILELYGKYKSHVNSRYCLLEIAKQARIDKLKDTVFHDAQRDYSKLSEDDIGFPYYLSVASSDELEKIKQSVLSKQAIRLRTFFQLLDAFAWNNLNAEELGRLVGKCNVTESSGWEVRFQITDAATRADFVTLCSLCDVFLCQVEGAVAGKDKIQVYQILKEKEWLAELVSELLSQLVERSAEEPVSDPVVNLLVRFTRGILEYDHGHVETGALKTSLEKHLPVRDAYIKALAQSVGENANALFDVFVSHLSILHVTAAEAMKLGLPALASFLEQYERPAERQTPQRRKKDKRDDSTRKNKEELLKRLDGMRNGTDENALIWVARSLFQSRDASHYGEVAMREFREKYGDEIATAARAGLSKLWRAQAPAHDADNPMTVYWKTIAGLQGVSLELENSQPALLSLTAEEVRQALDYGLYEINGLPKWFWRVAELHNGTANSFLTKCIEDFHLSSFAADRSKRLMTSLHDTPELFKVALIPAIWRVVQARTDLSDYEVSTALEFVSASQVISGSEFASVATSKIFNEKIDSNAVRWATYWLLFSPVDFFAALQEWSANHSNEAEQLITGIAAYLEEGRGAQLLALLKKKPENAEVLKQLYLEVRKVIRREDDERREPNEVYAIGERESVQMFRDRLPSLIASENSRAAYVVIKSLETQAQSENERIQFQRLATRMAEAMHAPSAMTEAEFLHFEQELRRPSHTIDAFGQEVENDILELKQLIETSDVSPRRLLRAHDKLASDETRRALEEDFQILLASQLTLIAGRRYAVVREEQLPEATRRDISLIHPQPWKVSLELKASATGWTCDDYRDALHKQLVGQYMRSRQTTIGFLIILFQEKRSNGWVVSPGTYVDEQGLIRLLQNEANGIMGKHAHLRLRVIGIDATEPIGTARQRKNVQAKKQGKPRGAQNRQSR